MDPYSEIRSENELANFSVIIVMFHYGVRVRKLFLLHYEINFANPLAFMFHRLLNIPRN